MKNYRVSLNLSKGGELIQIAFRSKALNEYDATIVSFVKLLNYLGIPVEKNCDILHIDFKIHVVKVEEMEEDENEKSDC